MEYYSSYLKKRMPLTMVPEGEEVIITDIYGGRNVVRRLFDMGLIPGTKIKVLYHGFGPLLVDVKDSRIALGLGIAMKIMVERYENK